MTESYDGPIGNGMNGEIHCRLKADSFPLAGGQVLGSPGGATAAIPEGQILALLLDVQGGIMIAVQHQPAGDAAMLAHRQ